MNTVIMKTKLCKLQDEIIAKALHVLKQGGLVVYPTDTVYGITGDTTPQGLKAVYQAKGRQQTKPTPILLSESHIATLLVETPPIFWELARKYWPGPLTIVSKKLPNTPPIFRNWEKIGVRLPAHPIPRILAASLEGYIIGTSANISGLPTPSNPKEIEQQIRQNWKDPLLIIDCGPAEKTPSTVVEIINNKELRVLRQGAIKV